jgi:hypothetical protein
MICIMNLASVWIIICSKCISFIAGFGDGKRDRRCQILGMLRFDAERLEDCFWWSDTRCAVPRSPSEAKAQMFPSIILNVSLFARWYWNVLKVFRRLSSPVYQALIESIEWIAELFGTPVVTSLRQQRGCKHLL